MMTSFSEPLLRRFCTTNRFRPTGGVTSAVSTNKIIMMPNQIGSKPSLNITGAMIGMVVIIIDKVSMKQPKIT